MTTYSGGASSLETASEIVLPDRTSVVTGVNAVLQRSGSIRGCVDDNPNLDGGPRQVNLYGFVGGTWREVAVDYEIYHSDYRR